ncbi:MAG: lipocalin-like domain-containing protein [Candidatus Competibacteraceae bacterium]|jgi:predicted secreted hydrolase|nr:lipocalin-like domain-containing protein [Candidatus Competibacteraceae bacterium]
MHNNPALIGLLAYILLGLSLCSLRPDSPPEAAVIPVSATLGGDDTEGYQRAYAPRLFEFPADHGPHPDFRTEWWYATGNLADTMGRRFGYQLTLFRVALSPNLPSVDSDWGTRQVYMGHFALTDVAGNQHYGFERFSRAAVGLAGAQAHPFQVWLEDWSFAGAGDTGTLYPLRIQAQEQGIALDITLKPVKPVVFQGDRGLSQKSAEPGNASYYYSYTRLESHGTVQVNGRNYTVSGASWLDREWSTSALGSDQSGWDWFALQLDDGRDLMFYRLRGQDGAMDRHSSGILVDVGGATRKIDAADVKLESQAIWISPETGDRYPSRWRLQVPTEKLDLTISPFIEDQEMRLSVRYWEGAVAVIGTAADKPITGQGYVEMTRYETAP